MANISFGERMRRARLQLAWTQLELGARVAVSGATIGNWEAGKTDPSPVVKKRLQEILGIERKRKNGVTPQVPNQEVAQTVPSAEAPSVVGAWLSRTRLESRLSVAELATKSGVSAPAIYNIESGRIANPRPSTVERLEKALGRVVPADAKQELKDDSTIEGLGEFLDFDPHADDDRPAVSGVYVLYDISERPIYVGEGGNIRKRIRDHEQKFWFRQPIVETGAFVEIKAETLRRQVETVLIKFLKSNAVINKKNVDR